MKRKQKYMAAFLVLILIQLTLGSFITKTDAKEVITTRIINYTKGTQPPESGKTGEQGQANEPDQTEIPSPSIETDQPAETGQTEEVNKHDSPEQTVESKEEEQKEEPKDEEPEEDDIEEDLPKEYTGSIKLDVKELSLKQGDTYQLKATLTGDNKTDSKLSYKTSNKKILNVTQKGVIQALHWGEASVTVSLGKAKTACKVTVTKDLSITVSAAGDCTLSSDIKQPAGVNFFSVYKKQKKDSYFLKNVKSIFEKDDLTIVNFEGTLSSRGKRVDKQWAFRGKPSFIQILKEGSVEAVAFANNHTRDYGADSYNDTIDSFKKAGIAYSTYGKSAIYEVKGVKVGMISIQEVGNQSNSEVTLRKELKAMKKKKPGLLIVSFHWGIERTSKITASQSKFGRIAIEEGGADLVLGHHPHVLQPVEKYKDSYIVYSLGNFCFGGNTNPPDKDTMIYQQTFSFHNDKLVPDDNVKIIPCSVSSSSKINNYQPTPSTGSERKRILKKINGYCKQYGISFDSDGKIRVKQNDK